MITLFSYLALFSQILTSVLSVLFFKKYKTKFYIFLVIIFCLTSFTEAIGKYMISLDMLNNHLYLCYSFFLFNLIAITYFFILKTTKYIILFSFIFNVTFFVFILKDISYLNSVIIGAFNTSFYSFFYLKKLLISKEIINYKKHLAFWVSVGFLVFYLPSIPFFLMIKIMENRILFFILHILTILMNLLIIYGLITCNNKKLKY